MTSVTIFLDTNMPVKILGSVRVYFDMTQTLGIFMKGNEKKRVFPQLHEIIALYLLPTLVSLQRASLVSSTPPKLSTEGRRSESQYSRNWRLQCFSRR